MERSLKGKVVLITGAGVRVGRAIAEAVAKAGARVAVHHHSSKPGAETLVRQVTQVGGEAAAFEADLTQDAQIPPLVARVEAQWGGIDALVNSAARFDRSPFAQTSSELLDRQWALNARAPYLLTQAVARGMSARGSGDVVNIVDIGGVWQSWRNYSAYCMTKAAMASLTRSLAYELAPDIRVNGVAPGAVLPPEEMSPEQREALRSRIPQGRFGSAEDVANTVLFLLTGPQFITGQILAVDGGRSLGAAGLEG